MDKLTTEELSEILLGIHVRYQACLDGIEVCNEEPAYADSRQLWEARKAVCESAYAKVQTEYLARKDR